MRLWFQSCNPVVHGQQCQCPNQRVSFEYSAINGVTIAEICATSPLGKLASLLVLNHAFGSFDILGLSLLKINFPPCALTSVNSMASVDCQNVLPSRESLPSHKDPPTTTKNEPYWRSNCFFLDQMPLSSFVIMWSMPKGPSATLERLMKPKIKSSKYLSMVGLSHLSFIELKFQPIVSSQVMPSFGFWQINQTLRL